VLGSRGVSKGLCVLGSRGAAWMYSYVLHFDECINADKQHFPTNRWDFRRKAAPPLLVAVTGTSKRHSSKN